jgi:EmrB/QacA subfamily drug resistance transporter
VSRRTVVLIGLILCAFMAAFEATVVSTVMPTVLGDLGGVEHYSWVFTAYLLASTVTVPVYGKLADLYGRKPVLLFGVTVFMVGSAASGLSSTMTQLIVFRAVQGLGAGAMQPITLTIVGDLYNIEERARTQALFGAVWGSAGLAGPLLGGLIVTHLSWPWVFFINLPFGLLAAALVIAALRENVEPRRHALDIAGATLLTLGVLGLLLGSVLGLAAAAVLLTLFVRVEKRAAEPILSLRLFGARPIWVASAANGLLGAAMFAALTYVPLFVQAVLGGTPTQAGGTIGPMIIGWPIASALGGRLLPRIGARFLIRLGLWISAVASVALALLIGRADRLLAQLAMLAFGFGLGFGATSLLVAVQNVVEWEQRGVVTAATMFFRTIGGTLAIGGLGRVLSASLGAAADDVNRLLAAGHASVALAPELLQPLRSSLGHIFALTAVLAVAAAVVGMWFPHVGRR